MCCPVGGTRERVTLDKQTKESQFVGDNTGVRITGAAGLVLLTVSDYTLEMGKLSDFAEQTEYPLLADLRAQLEKVAARYSTDGAFDYDAALAAHLKVYRPQFDAVTLTLSDENIQPNEALLKAQKGKKEINAALASVLTTPGGTQPCVAPDILPGGFTVCGPGSGTPVGAASTPWTPM